MSNLRERAAALQERGDDLRAEFLSVLERAGSLLLHKPPAPEGSELAACRERDRQVAEQVKKAEAARDRIVAIQERLKETRQRTAEVQAEMRTLAEDLGPVHEAIGQKAFAVYRSNPLVDQQYADIFTPLVEVNSEISGLDAAIAEQQAMLESRPFLERMAIRGRIALLKNRRATRTGTFRRLVRSAGREITATPFIDEIGDPQLTEAAEPYRVRLTETRDREVELQELETEHKRLTEELDALCHGTRPQRRREELDEDVGTLKQTRTVVLADLARAARELPVADLPAKCKPLLAQAAEIEERLNRLSAVADRVRAALEAERAEEQLQQLDTVISEKESRLAKLKKEVAGLKRDRKSVSERLQEHLAVRGDPAELEKDDLLDDL